MTNVMCIFVAPVFLDGPVTDAGLYKYPNDSQGVHWTTSRRGRSAFHANSEQDIPRSPDLPTWKNSDFHRSSGDSLSRKWTMEHDELCWHSHWQGRISSSAADFSDVDFFNNESLFQDVLLCIIVNYKYKSMSPVLALYCWEWKIWTQIISLGAKLFRFFKNEWHRPN